MSATNRTSEDASAERPVQRCYHLPKAAQVDRALYDALSNSGWENIVKHLTVQARSGQAWELRAGQTCRIVVAHGPQVGDINVWNLHDTRERFYSGKTRQIHSSHLSTYDRLWSNLPYLRPLVTISKDTLHYYGIDSEGGGIHDVIGTRCDPYTTKMITGTMGQNTCHQNLMNAIKQWNLQETDVHDVFNIFMCTGFSKDTNEYFCRASPAKVGDYIEFVADMDVLMALSACPYGDVSIPVGEEVPASKCFPLEVYIGQPSQELIQKWHDSKLM